MARIFAGLLVLTSSVACGDNSDNQAIDAALDAAGPPAALAALGIVGASSLVLAPALAVKATDVANVAAGDTYRLQRVNADGTVVDVTVTDADGNVVTSSVRVESILDAGAHVVMQIQISSMTATFRPIVLVRKADGAAFEMGAAIDTLDCQNQLRNYDQAPYDKAPADGLGAVYVALPCGSMNAANVVRIDTTASPPTATVVLPADTHVWDYAPDAAGSIAYIAAVGGSPGVWRARSASGQTKNLPMYSDPWQGSDGLVHFIGGTTEICPSSAGCTSDLIVGSGTIDVALGAQGGALGQRDLSYARLIAGTDVYFVSPYSQAGFQGPLTISRWRAGQAAPYSTEWPNHTFRAAAASSTDVYLATLDAAQNPVLGRFAMSDLSAPPVSVIPDGQFDISRLSASADGTLTFAGLRLSDSKEVVGRISPTGDVTISFEYSAPVGTLVPL